MGVGQPQPEAFGALGEAAQVAAAVEEVVDELPPGGLLLTHGEQLGALVALGERVDRLLDGGERAVGRARDGRPGRARGGQVRADQGPQSQARARGPLPEGATGLDLVAGEAAAGPRGVGQDAGVAVQVLIRYLVFRHAAPVVPRADHGPSPTA